MNTTKRTVLVGLALCAMALGALGSGENPVQRAIKMKAEMVGYVDLTDGSFVSPNWGEATHLGKFTNVGVGWMNPLTLMTISAEGTAVAANGDELFWTANGPSRMDFNGGTGRFANATGGITWVLTVEEVEVDPVAMMMTLYCTYTAEGTITY